MNTENYNTVPSKSDYYKRDEITLRKLIFVCQEFYREIIRRWKLIVLVAAFCGISMLLYTLYIPITYAATYTFMVNEDEGGRAGISAILGQFGFGGGSSGSYNLDKVIDLSKSRRIINTALFEKVMIGENEDYLANHIIHIYNFHKKWKRKKPALKDFLFTNSNISSFNQVERTALSKIYKVVVTKKDIEGLVDVNYSQESSIIWIAANTISEDLSIELTIAIYKKLSDFYIKKTIEKEQATYELIAQKSDSLEQALNVANIALLRFDDRNRNLGLRVSEARKIQLQQETQKLVLAYAKVFENQQIAQFNLENKTPVFQPIDIPFSPVTLVGEFWLINLIKGGILGGFLAVLFIIGQNIAKNALSEKIVNTHAKQEITK